MNTNTIKKIESALLAVLVLTACGCSTLNGEQEEKVQTETLNTEAEKVTKKDLKLSKELVNQLELRTVWSQNVSKGKENFYLKLNPAIIKDRVYVNNHQGELYCLDLKSGKEIWKIKDENVEYTSGIGIGDGRLFIGTGDGRVIAREVNTGKLEWVTRTSSEILAVPTADNGVTIISSSDGSVVGLDSTSGREIWNYRRTSPRLTVRGNSAPIIDGNSVISGLDSGRIVSLDLALGKLIWNKALTLASGKTDLERMVDIDADPVIEKSVIYAGSFQGGISALSALDGKTLWTREISTYQGLAIDDEHVYVVDDKSNIWALKKEDGISVWKQDTLRDRYLSPPVIFKGNLVLADFEGYAHWIDSKSGELLSHKRISKKPIIAKPLTKDSLILFRTNRKVVALQHK